MFSSLADVFTARAVRNRGKQNTLSQNSGTEGNCEFLFCEREMLATLCDGSNGDTCRR
jgi:hypothetical protein